MIPLSIPGSREFGRSDNIPASPNCNVIRFAKVMPDARRRL